MTNGEEDIVLRPVFSLRLDTSQSTQEVAKAVSKALALNFKLSGYAPGRSELYGAEALGMLFDLVAWPPWPEDGVYTMKLQGVPSDAVYSDQDRKCDLSRHLQDTLMHAGAGDWYIPSLEQVLHEIDLGEQAEPED